MSLEALLSRAASYTVTSGNINNQCGVTEKLHVKQGGNMGNMGNMEKNEYPSEKQKTPSSSAASSSSDSVKITRFDLTLKRVDYFSHVTHVTDVTASNGAGCSGNINNSCDVTDVTVYGDLDDTYSEWLVAHSTGERAIHCFAPPKSREDVQALYQGATVEAVTPVAEPTPLPPDAIPLVYAYLNHVGETCPATRTEFVTALERDHRRLAWLYGEVVRMGLVEPPEPPAVGLDARLEPTKANAVCCQCRHWTPDTINPAGGLGQCQAQAPASRRAGSLWPHSDAIVCRVFEEVAA